MSAPRRSLRRQVARGFAAALAVLVVLLAIVVTALVIVISTGDDLVNRWQPAQTASQQLLADLVNQETGVRGYALGKRTPFLQPYYDGRTAETAHRSRLLALVAGDAAVRTDLDKFAAAVDSWRSSVAVPTIARVRTSDSSAFAVAYSDRAKASFDRVRARAAAVSADIQAGQHGAIVARQRAIEFVWAAVAITVAIMVLLGATVWRGLRRLVLDPVQGLAEQTRAVAGGELTRDIVASGPPEITGLGADVDAMRARIVAELASVEQARGELVARSDDLARSNADLEQFAYIASHDLSEPLRKVANFCQLLERQYAAQLDDKARMYIGFAVDGAKRMQILIADLLAFSRVGRTTEDFAAVDLDVVLARALTNLDQRITDSGAVVVRPPLPTVTGDASLLTALLQNLIGNAVKYRGADPPRVELAVEQVEDHWLFTVTDNGIGIEQKYAERIFAIFQRLHLRDEYGGTGIGLALCRKIVEFHGGRIWLAENSDRGARFQFTLPVMNGDETNT